MQQEPNYGMHKKQHRVKTFVRRESRITRAQKRALTELLELYQLPLIDGKLNISEILPNADRFTVELGFGDGESLIQRALANPSTAHLGIEVYRPGIGKCLLNLHKRNIHNVRISTSDARDVMAQQIPANLVNELIILFPDPWPKARHHKRRLINADFIELCVDRLAMAGSILIVTDSRDYADQITHALEENNQLRCLKWHRNLSGVPTDQSPTRFARKAIHAGSPIFEMHYIRDSCGLAGSP